MEFGKTSRIAPWLCAFLSAYLLWAAFPPCGEAVALVCALAPLLAVSRRCTPRTAALAWFAGGFAFWFATLGWMPAICKNNGPWPLVVLGWGGLAAVCAVYFALFGWLSAVAWRRCAARGFAWRLATLFFIEPVLWAGLEWTRGMLFTGFAWNFLGTAIASMGAFSAPARWGGVYLVSALVVLVNGVFATLACRLVAQMRGVDEWPEDWERWKVRLARNAETALPLALAALTVFAAARDRLDGEWMPLRVALVQRNAPCIFRSSNRENPYVAFGSLLNAASAARPDLVVFGESAMVEFGMVRGDDARSAAGVFLRQAGASALIAGGSDFDRSPEGARREYNAAACYAFDSATNVAVQVYHKQHLVPFGEYIPFDKWIPVLQRLSPVGVSCWPGEPKVFEFAARSGEIVKAAPIICFEDTVPSLARAAARLGAQVIVLVTNDSWFSNSCEAEQHAAQAVMRAVETGLPVIRVGNSGVTGLISPGGTTRWLTDDSGRPSVDRAGVQVDSLFVPKSPSLTLYVRLGDWPLIALFVIALAGILFLPKTRGMA